MVIYGMFFGAHQYSTTLIKDGKILYAVENERITRVNMGIVGLNLLKHLMLLSRKQQV